METLERSCKDASQTFCDDFGSFRIHGHLSIILVESGEESGFQVEPGINGVHRKTPEPIKG